MATISNSNWQHIENYLQRDDRCILPIGSTEQHAFLSLSTDSILAEKISRDAAEPLGIPVFPVVHYGITPGFMAYPGTVTLKKETLCAVVEDILESLVTHGFKKILIVNGHGGNILVSDFVKTWTENNPPVKTKFCNWWNAPKTWAKVMEIDPVASHASWMENFPWTRLANVSQPQFQKPLTDVPKLRTLTPAQVRATLGEGNFGGYFEKDDAAMMEIWKVAVDEVRDLLENNW